MITLEHFTGYVRDALEHLYDPDQLQANRLNELFGIVGQVDTPAALQKILTKAIESLEPEGTAPAQSRSWRLYELLVCRYLQQANVQEVADQLGISHRHLRREQNAAIDTLAHRLWNQFDLDGKASGDFAARATHVGETSPTVDEELNWLKNLSADEGANPSDVLSSVLKLVQPLAAHNQVTLTPPMAPGLPKVIAHPMVMRQLFLSLFDYAIARAPGGSLKMQLDITRRGVQVQVVGQPAASGLRVATEEQSSGLDVVRKLANLSRAELMFSTNANTFVATLTFPIVEQFCVLVIDDNADTLALLQRYAKGTQYRLVEETEPDNAIRMAEQIGPSIIVLDVMMPRIDGWEILARLRHHPTTRNIPIIVCTILATESLALSLGATAYLRKPVTHAAFLAALDQQMEDAVTALR
jgi:CheY-like chemotaxis protein